MNNVLEKYALDKKRRFTSQEFSKSNLDDSISLLIHSAIFNMNNGSHYDFTFGNTIWNIDFDLFKIQGDWENKLAHSISAKITDNIDTIHNIDVSVNKSEVSSNFKYIKYPVIKYYLDFHVKAINAVTLEEYYFHTCLFLSPI